MQLYLFLTYASILLSITGIAAIFLAYTRCKPHPSFTFSSILVLALNVIGMLNQLWTLCVNHVGPWYLKIYVILAGCLSISFGILACKFPALKDDYFYFFKQLKQIFKIMKKVAVFPESMQDFVDKINGAQQSTPLTKAINFPSASNGYWVDSDPDGVQCLCKEIPEEETLVIQFKRANNTTYLSTSVDFVGGRPPRKPN